MAKQFTRDTLKEIRNHIQQKEARYGPDLRNQTETERIIAIAKAENTKPATQERISFKHTLDPKKASTGGIQMPSRAAAETEKKAWTFTAEQLAAARAIQDEYKTSGGKQSGGRRAANTTPAPRPQATITPAKRPATTMQNENARPQAAAAPHAPQITNGSGNASVRSSASTASTGSGRTATPGPNNTAVLEIMKTMKGEMRFLQGHSQEHAKEIIALQDSIEKLKAAKVPQAKLIDIDDEKPAKKAQDAKLIAQLQTQIKQCEETIHDLDNEANELRNDLTAAREQITSGVDAVKAMTDRLDAYEAEAKKRAAAPIAVGKSSFDNDTMQDLLVRLNVLEEADERRRGLGASNVTTPFMVTVQYPDGSTEKVQTFAKMLVNRLIERIMRKKNIRKEDGKMATLTYLGEGLGHTSCVGEWDIVEDAKLYFNYA